MRNATRIIQITNTLKQTVIGLLVESGFVMSIIAGTKQERGNPATNTMFAGMEFGFNDKVERK